MSVVSQSLEHTPPNFFVLLLLGIQSAIGISKTDGESENGTGEEQFLNFSTNKSFPYIH